MQTLEHLTVKDKKVLLRVDFNVPLSDGKIIDDTRIQAVLPTIDALLKKGAAIIILSHLGRPDGKNAPNYSLAPCAQRLEELLEKPLTFVPDNCISAAAINAASQLKSGEILLLENLRFHKEEQHPTEDHFAKKLAQLGNCYVCDAFGVAHREDSSITRLPTFFPGQVAAGLLMQKEVEMLSSLLKNPTHPFYFIVGGGKVSDKIGTLSALLPKADALFIGGAMAFTFLKAQGVAIGISRYEKEAIECANKLLLEAKKLNVAIHLPIDFICAKNLEAIDTLQNCSDIPEDFQGFDIGEKTVTLWKGLLQNAKTIFWNGPMGVYEKKEFAKGTEEIAQTIAKLQKATKIACGGDSLASIKSCHIEKEFTHLSTGGGASLEFIEKGSLPGVEAVS